MKIIIITIMTIIIKNNYNNIRTLNFSSQQPKSQENYETRPIKSQPLLRQLKYLTELLMNI